LVIGEDRAALWPTVERAFRGEPGVELAHEQVSVFVRRPDLDALIVTSWIANERYGGVFAPGASGVVSTGGDPGGPPWVVTTPGWPAHLEFDDSEQATLVREGPEQTPAQDALVEFTTIFGAVDTFNLSSSGAKIERVGCDLELIRVPLSKTEPEIIDELESIRTAFRRFRQSST